MKHDLQNILELVKKFTPIDVDPDSDLYMLLKDSFAEFIKAYSAHLNVDLRGYREFFHTNDCEKYSLLTSLRTYKRIIVTPRLLLKFVKAGKWDMTYPPYLMRVF